MLTDDKVWSGPRLRPGSLSQEPTTEEVQPMETDPSEQSTSAQTQHKTPPKEAKTPSLAAKLAALKRKASDPPATSVSKQRHK